MHIITLDITYVNTSVRFLDNLELEYIKLMDTRGGHANRPDLGFRGVLSKQ